MATDNEKKCPNCGFTLQEDETFCSNCGTLIDTLLENARRCPNCKVIINLDETFCHACGTKVSDSKEANKDENLKDSKIEENNKQDKGTSKAPIVLFVMALVFVLGFFLIKDNTIEYINLKGANNPNPYCFSFMNESFYLNEPELDGYIFEGWYTDKSLTNRVSWFNTKNIFTRKLYANWYEEYYTIDYSIDGYGANNPTRYSVTTETFTLNNPSKNGYEFKGWYDSYSGQKVDKIVKGSVGNRDLYAEWNALTYRIYYHDTYNCFNPNPSTYSTGEVIYLSDLDDSRNGYEFAGWQSDRGYRISNIYNQTGDVNLYATWKMKEYYIEYENYDYSYYDSNNNYHSNNNNSPTSYTVNSSFNISFKPTKDGYTFTGWCDQYGYSRSSIYQGTTGDLILTAQWQPKTYSISYSNTYGCYNPNPKSFKSDDGITYLADLERSDYDFLGWYKQGEGYVDYIDTSDYRNQSYEAKWQHK